MMGLVDKKTPKRYLPSSHNLLLTILPIFFGTTNLTKQESRNISKQTKMKLSPCGLKNTTTTAIPVQDEEGDGENNSGVVLDDEVFVVTVDSRGKSPSDLEGYKEISCNYDFFQDHVHDDPRNICVKSQVAGLCGLDLKLYFHDDSHLRHLEELDHPLSSIGRTNGVGTLLTFNPETGEFNHAVHSKAYVLMNDGRTPLSKRQVWGIVELIREARSMYEDFKKTHAANKGGSFEDTETKNILSYSSSPALQEAYKELLNWCAHYQQGTWVPHSIYEPRHPRHHHHRQHHNDKEEDRDGKKGCGCKDYNRQESGVSDAATCHHGRCHTHHDVNAQNPSHSVEVKPEDEVDLDHHLPHRYAVHHSSSSEGKNPANHERNYKFYNNLLHCR
jgi:hypothetical protein